MAGAPLIAAMSPYTAPVHINVGGTTYTSCLETLTKFPHSKLAKLFNGTLPVAVDPVKQRYFLDRDGKMFRHILNFLRNSEMVLPDTFSEFNLLKKEAAYFEIEDLMKTLEYGQQSDGGTEQLEQSTDDNNTETCAAQPQGRERKRRKKRNKQNVKDKQVGEMLEVDTENEITEEHESDLKKETLKGNGSNAMLLSAKSNSTENEQTNVEDESQVPGARDALQVHSAEEVVVDKELICVVTSLGGGVKELWCSDDNFKLELPETKDKFSAYRYFIPTICMPSQTIHVDYIRYKIRGSLGFPWVAAYLFKQGFNLATSSGGGEQLYNFFVK